MNSLPPVFSPSIFNTNAFQGSIYITKEDADRLYLSISAGKNLGYIDGVTPGAVTANKALVFDSNASITGALSLANNLGDMLVLTSTLSSSRNTIKFVTDSQTYEIGSRGSTATNGGQFYIYNGAYRFLMNSSGDTSILSSTDSSSSSSGALKIAGGVGIAKNCYISGILTLDRVGTQLNIVNGANSGLIEVSGGGSGSLRLVNGTALNISSSGLTVASSSTALARYNLDMQASAADIKLCLFQSDSNGTYGFGASGSALNIITGGSSIKFYKTSTGGSLGTNTATIDTDGNLEVLNNLISNAGLFLKQGFSASGRSGTGLVAHMANSTTAELFAYNYSTTAYKDIKVANGMLFNGGTGYAGIGFTAGDTIAYPFAINTTVSSSVPGSYGYLSSSGSGTGSNTGSVQVSLYASGRIFCVEIDCYSDRRKKHKIEKIKEVQANEFIDVVEPVEFEWRGEDDGKRTGYIAQDVLKNNHFKDLVTFHVDNTMKGDHESPEGYSLTIQYSQIIPILHTAIKSQKKRIEQLELEIKDLNKRLDEVIDYINED